MTSARAIHRHFQERWAGSMAGWSGTRCYIYAHTGAAAGLHRTEPDLFRLHVTSSTASKHFPVSTRVSSSSLGQMVPSVSGGQLDDWLASPLSDHATAQRRTRPDAGSSGLAADELVHYRPVDGLSAVRPNRAPNNHQFRNHCRVSAVPFLLGQLEVGAVEYQKKSFAVKSLQVPDPQKIISLIEDLRLRPAAAMRMKLRAVIRWSSRRAECGTLTLPSPASERARGTRDSDRSYFRTATDLSSRSL